MKSSSTPCKRCGDPECGNITADDQKFLKETTMRSSTIAETEFQRFHRRAMEVSSDLKLRGQPGLTEEQTVSVALALRTVRREALEEAANRAQGQYGRIGTVIAASIRALKESEDTKP